MPRVGFPGGPRLEWYDRNPITRSLQYSATVAPHSGTLRASYTVPTGKKAFLEALLVYIRRVTAATTAGLISDSVFYTPSGGSGTYLLASELVDNTVNASKIVSHGLSSAVVSGDVLEVWTSDGSTGGTVGHVLTVKITEFSA